MMATTSTTASHGSHLTDEARLDCINPEKRDPVSVASGASMTEESGTDPHLRRKACLGL